MTVVISDLVARISAQGAAEAQQQLRAVGETATQTAAQVQRAYEIMAQAAIKQGSGGTVPSLVETFQRGGVVPHEAALAQARAEMEKTAAAAQQTVAPTQAVARAARDHAEAASTGARAVQSVSEGWRLSESSIVRFGTALVGINLGISLVAGTARVLHQEIVASVDAAVQLDRVARGLTGTYGAGAPAMAAFAQRLAPQAGISLTSAGQALTAAGPLGQYGLTGGQIQALTGRAADLASRFGQPFDRTFQAVVQTVQSGGSELDRFGLKLDDTRIKTEAYGGALAGTFDRMTTAQQIAVRFNLLMEQSANVQGSAAGAANTLSGSLDRLGTSFDRLREKSGGLVGGGLQDPVSALTAWANQISGTGAAGDRRGIVADPTAPGGVRIISGPPQFDVAGAIAASGGTSAGPPSFIGPPPQRAIDRLTQGAQNAQSLAGRAIAEAQAQLTALQVRSEERRLAVATELAAHRRDELQIEGQLAPLLTQQAQLQDRITIASRDNLRTRREMITAEQAQLRTTQITSAYDYEQRRLELRAEQSRAVVRMGGAPTEDISALRGQYRGLELQRAASGVDIAALDASRGVEVTQQQRTAEDLARQQRLTDLEGQRRALEDQTIPLQEQLRLTQDREASIKRALELQDLANTRTLVAAQTALNEANTVQLIADQVARMAADYSSGLRLGADALERSAKALELADAAVHDVVPLLTLVNPTESNRRIAAGLGGGGLGPAVNVPITINGASQQEIKDAAHQAVENALNQFFAGTATTGAPAPSTVGGAGR